MDKNKYIYLDNAATTPMDPRVIEEVNKHFKETYGNSMSLHSVGQKAAKLLIECRKKIAALINADRDDIFFTSSGTEADNIAVLGVATKCRDRGNHIITSNIEHHAVEKPYKHLEKEGFEGQLLFMQNNGGVETAEVAVEKPSTLATSGPAAGPTSAITIGRLHGEENLLSVDMGGTSFDIAIVDKGVDHRVSAHLKGVDVATSRSDVARQLDRVACEAVLGHGNGVTGGNAPQQRHAYQVGSSSQPIQSFGEPDTARYGPVAFDVAFLLQGVQIVVHHRGRRNVHRFADLANRGRVPVIQRKGLDELHDFALSL